MLAMSAGTNAADKCKTVTLYFNDDGGPILLDGSHDKTLYQNCYFLGISTINGTGELEYLGHDTYRAIYGDCTCNSPTVPEIWHSSIGTGELTFTIHPRKD
jgi:hypothetical protein